VAQPPNEASPSVGSNSGVLNGGLTGRILSTFRDEPGQMDLSTGVITALPIDSIQDWLARNNFRSDRESYFGSGGTDSSQYIQTVPKCIRRPRTLSFDSCIAIYSLNFEKTQQFRLSDIELSGQASLSPSGKFIAANEYNPLGGYRSSEIVLVDLADKSIVEIFGIDLGEQGSQQYRRSSNTPLAWTPNGALVYTAPSEDRVIVYITKPDSLEIVESIALPALYSGTVTSLDVSPDGSKLLMGYNPRNGLNYGGVLLLDFETLSISVPAIVPSEVDIVPLGDNIKGYIRTPRWSPDGQWIMVVEGVGAYFDFNIATYEYLYAVPADKVRTVLTTDSPTDAILIKMEHPDSHRGLIDAWLGDDSSYDWVQ